MEENKKKYWEQVREFNLSRTPFWISILFQVLFIMGPFLAIWILIGPDFKNETFNYYNHLLTPQVGYLLLVVFGYLIYAVLLSAISWLFRWQKPDVFTYTFGLSFVFLSIILNGIWMVDWEYQEVVLRILIRFIIALASGLIGVFFGVIVTTFARNSDYKMEEKNAQMLDEYHQEVASLKKTQRLKKAAAKSKAKPKKKTTKKKSKSSAEVNEELVKKYDAHQAKQKTIQAQKKAKLDAKETKRRQKDQKKK